MFVLSNIVIDIDYSAYCNYQLFTLHMVEYGDFVINVTTHYSIKGQVENVAHCQTKSHVPIMQLA